jgi:hypothetical protein
MSSLSGSAVGGDKIPEGSEKGATALEMTPPASWKHGRPKGSCNKKTLEALAAVDAIAPSTSIATRTARVLGDVGIPEKRGPGHPKGSGRKTELAAAAAPSSPRRRGQPPGSKNKKTLATLGATASIPARSRAMALPPDGPSRLWSEKPALQPPAYISAEGWSTCIIPVLAGARDLLHLPSKFTDSMEGQEMAYAKLRECSGSQPKYCIKIYYDGQGVCYFCDGWSKYFIDYGVHEGWFLLLTRHDGKKDFTICLFDDTSSPIPSLPGHEGRTPLTSNVGFSGVKSMRRSRRAEGGEHLQGEEHLILLG